MLHSITEPYDILIKMTQVKPCHRNKVVLCDFICRSPIHNVVSDMDTILPYTDGTVSPFRSYRFLSCYANRIRFKRQV